jgi:hypothetical protein
MEPPSSVAKPTVCKFFELVQFKPHRRAEPLDIQLSYDKDDCEGSQIRSTVHKSARPNLRCAFVRRAFAGIVSPTTKNPKTAPGPPPGDVE